MESPTWESSDSDEEEQLKHKFSSAKKRKIENTEIRKRVWSSSKNNKTWQKSKLNKMIETEKNSVKRDSSIKNAKALRSTSFK